MDTLSRSGHGRRTEPAMQDDPSLTDFAATLAMALDTQARAAADPVLKVLVLGLQQSERHVVEGSVKLSQRRTQRLQLVDPRQTTEVDVVIIDALNPHAMAWAARRPNLADTAVVWLDAQAGPRGHVLAHRPVPWSLLPLILARALEHHCATRRVWGLRTTPVAAQLSTGGCVLVVESGAEARAELSSLLRSRGADVVEMPDAWCAIRAMREQAFAWALVGLQSGASGTDQPSHEACRAIKRVAPALPVLMLGRQASAFDRMRAKKAGAAALLMLPQDAQQLFNAIDQSAARITATANGAAWA